MGIELHHDWALDRDIIDLDFNLLLGIINNAGRYRNELFFIIHSIQSDAKAVMLKGSSNGLIDPTIFRIYWNQFTRLPNSCRNTTSPPSSPSCSSSKYPRLCDGPRSSELPLPQQRKLWGGKETVQGSKVSRGSRSSMRISKASTAWLCGWAASCRSNIFVVFLIQAVPGEQWGSLPSTDWRCRW